MTRLNTQWQLDPEISFLNHGSFGACPTTILQRQQGLRDQIEREPVAFFTRELEPLLDGARDALADFLHIDGQDLVFVNNATSGVNTVLRSLTLEPGDELLTTNQAYNACRNALEFVAKRSGAVAVVAEIPFPLEHPDEVFEAIMRRVTDQTRIVLLDHVTSPTGLVLPADQIVRALEEKGIDCLVDGAHAPGMLDLDLGALAPAYYTGNCHKWLCTPKGSAFLFVRRDRQQQIRPLTISHGANSPRTDRSKILLEFDWPGTTDPTPWLCIPAAIETMGGLFPGGWQELRRRNRELALLGQKVLCDTLGVDTPAPPSMIGSLASVPIPSALSTEPPDPLRIDPLQDALYTQDRIEVPVMSWPSPPQRVVRISAQAYNQPEQYRLLAERLAQKLSRY